MTFLLLLSDMSNSFFIVDDHEMLRSGIIGWLRDNTDFICRGDAETLQSAMDSMIQMQEAGSLPDILISDINFNGENLGFDLISQVHEKFPQIKIVVYSMFYSPNVMKEAVLCGASGYISKNAKTEELLNCMNTVLAGGKYLEKTLVKNYMNYTDLIDSLTKREVDVVNLLLERMSNDEISEELQIKKRSVENYISSIYEKIGVMDRNSLIEKLS